MLMTKVALVAIVVDAMATVSTVEEIKTSQEEVVVLSCNMIATSTIFVATNASFSSDGGNSFSIDGDDLTQIMVVTGTADVLIEDIVMLRGVSSGSGAALTVLGGAAVELIRCTFKSNRADTGGAIYASRSTLVITDTVFAANSARDGGAIYVAESKLSIFDCFFEKNRADNDGGAVVARTSNAAIERSTLVSNAAVGAGGAVIACSSTLLVATDCTFRGNKAVSPEPAIIAKGGAVAGSESKLFLTRSRFDANSAEQGGAISNVLCTMSTSELKVKKNTAHLGGGVSLQQGDWSDVGSSIYNNNADMEGGGIYSSRDGRFTPKDTVVVNNEPDDSYASATGRRRALGDTAQRRRRRLLETDDAQPRKFPRAQQP